MKRFTIFAVALVTGLSVLPAAAGQATCRGRRATVSGTSGEDNLTGTSGRDVIVGRDGNDTINGRGGNDIICGDGGNDTLNGGTGDDTEDGGAGDDRWFLAFDPGDDKIDGGGGRDYINFNSDADLWDQNSRAEGSAYVSLKAGKARLQGVGRDSLVLGSVEMVEGTGQEDLIIGDGGDNWLNTGRYGGGIAYGLGGNDILIDGQDGQAQLRGGSGDDVHSVMDFGGDVRGGDGFDTLTFCGYGSTGADVAIDLPAQTATARNGEDVQEWTLDSIENGVGCRGDDTLVGTDERNILEGREGDDDLQGRGGDDELDGGAGIDSADGGDGEDTCRNAETQANCEL